VTPFWHDSSSASEVRSAQIQNALEQIGHVATLVLDDADDVPCNATSVASELKNVPRLRVRSQPPHNVRAKLNWIFNSRSQWPHGVAAERGALDRLLEMQKAFDLIWFFKFRSANFFPRWNWPSSVVDIDDVPSTFEKSVLRTTRSVSKRVSTSVRVWSWRRREKLIGERFSVITVCSEEDKQYLRNLGVDAPIHVVANGFNQPNVPPTRTPSNPPRIGFIGVFDHGPNLEGIRWFVKECWPRIKTQVPDARLRLVGRFSDGPLKPEGIDIDALGWMADPTSEIGTWSSMIVPVHLGAGTRGKIAHAFSLKCPVVSTPLGAHGYDAHDGVEMFLADSGDAFAEACVRTVRQPVLAAAVAERAWQRFLERWTWDAIRPHVWAAVDQCLRMKTSDRYAATVR